MIRLLLLLSAALVGLVAIATREYAFGIGWIVGTLTGLAIRAVLDRRVYRGRVPCHSRSPPS